MAWVPVVEKLKDALTCENWAAAEAQINILSKTDHPGDIFQNLTVSGLPALQRLTYIIPRGIDIDRMNKVVKTLTNFGYDINQQQSEFGATPALGWPPRKFTALLAAISTRNYHLVRSLLRHGARIDIRDASGNSPLHWATLEGSRDTFDLLLDFGASVTSSERERNGEEGMAHPLLHTAVDTGCPRMVAFLLRKDICDINEKAVYRDVDSGNVETFSPLGRAIRQIGAEIFWNLLDQPGIRVEMNEIYLSLDKVHANMAAALMGYLPDIYWVTVAREEGSGEERVPSLLWLLQKVCSALSLPASNYRRHMVCLPTLATVMKLFVDQGYDIHLNWKSTAKTPPVVREPLLHYVLRIDMNDRTNLLLQTLLELDQSQCVVPVTSGEGRKCLECILSSWTDCCLGNDRSKCWRRDGPMGEVATCCVDAVKLLISAGLNVSLVVIRKEFKYHFGYRPMIKLLYRNGVKIEDEYFSSETICTSDYPIGRELERELGELKEWKEKFDQGNPISLKNICRLRIRKMLTGREDLKMLEGLPDQLNEFVLRNDLV